MEVLKSVHPEVVLVALTENERQELRNELRALLHMRMDCYMSGRFLACLDRVSVLPI